MRGTAAPVAEVHAPPLCAGRGQRPGRPRLAHARRPAGGVSWQPCGSNRDTSAGASSSSRPAPSRWPSARAPSRPALVVVLAAPPRRRRHRPGPAPDPVRGHRRADRGGDLRRDGRRVGGRRVRWLQRDRGRRRRGLRSATTARPSPTRPARSVPIGQRRDPGRLRDAGPGRRPRRGAGRFAAPMATAVARASAQSTGRAGRQRRGRLLGARSRGSSTCRPTRCSTSTCSSTPAPLQAVVRRRPAPRGRGRGQRWAGRLDLTDVSDITSLDAGINAGEVAVTLPSWPMTGRLEVNAGAVRLCAPPDVALRIETEGSVLAATDLSEARSRRGRRRAGSRRATTSRPCASTSRSRPTSAASA